MTVKTSQGDFPATELWDAEVSDIDGFLIDLDGTMYQPGGLIPGVIVRLGLRPKPEGEVEGRVGRAGRHAWAAPLHTPAWP